MTREWVLCCLDYLILVALLIYLLHVLNCRNMTVVVSLWNDLATTLGQELLELVDTAPVVAIKALKVGDFQGITNSIPSLEYELKVVLKFLFIIFNGSIFLIF